MPCPDISLNAVLPVVAHNNEEVHILYSILQKNPIRKLNAPDDIKYNHQYFVEILNHKSQYSSIYTGIWLIIIRYHDKMYHYILHFVGYIQLYKSK